MDNSTRLQYLQAMGIELWQPRLLPPELISPEISDVESLLLSQDILPSALKPDEGFPDHDYPLKDGFSSPAGSSLVSEPVLEAQHQQVTTITPASSWQELKTQVANCTQCTLCETRTQTVFGSGNQQADWLVIGEAPGQSEDQQGLPFVGKAGLLLTEMLRSIGLSREQDVYIANILKCRPPNNRDPKPEEIASCNAYLQQQISLVQPKIILAVGRIAAQALLKTDQPIGKLRGRVHTLGTTPVVVVYHPAYLLRSLLEKRKAWQDLCLAMQIIKKR
jgi:DNA polymerase